MSMIEDMWAGEGDWTTYEGLAAEDGAEQVVFNKTATSRPAAASGWAAPRGSKNRKPTPTASKSSARVPSRGIDKKSKKKAARGAGLMGAKAAPAASVAEEEEEAVPSPYIANTKNPFAVLGEQMDAEEAAALEAEKAAAAAAKKPLARVQSSLAAVVSVFTEDCSQEKGSTPVARRTRHAIKAISKTLSDVVKAVSPMIERSRSASNNVGGVQQMNEAARDAVRRGSRLNPAVA